MLQARAGNRPYSAYRAPVCDLDGAGLPECRRLVPGIGRTEPPVAPVCKVSANSRQKGRRPAPRTQQTCSTKAGIWGISLPRFHENGHLCILAGNVARIMAEMAIFAAAFPGNRPSVRSSRKRGWRRQAPHRTEGRLLRALFRVDALRSLPSAANRPARTPA